MIEAIAKDNMTAEERHYWDLGEMIEVISHILAAAGMRETPVDAAGRWYGEIKRRPHKTVQEMIELWNVAINRLGERGDLESWMEGPTIGDSPESFDGPLSARQMTTIGVARLQTFDRITKMKS